MTEKNIHDEEVSVLIKTVLESPGITSTELREQVFRAEKIPGLLNEFAAKVRSESYKITDDDIKRLISNGYTEDEIFEVVVCAALGASKPILDAGLNALEVAANEA